MPASSAIQADHQRSVHSGRVSKRLVALPGRTVALLGRLPRFDERTDEIPLVVKKIKIITRNDLQERRKRLRNKNDKKLEFTPSVKYNKITPAIYLFGYLLPLLLPQTDTKL